MADAQEDPDDLALPKDVPSDVPSELRGKKWTSNNITVAEGGEEEKDNNGNDYEEDIPITLSKKNLKKSNPTVPASDPKQSMKFLTHDALDNVLPKWYLETTDLKELKSMRSVSRAFKAWVDVELDRRIRRDIIPACPLETSLGRYYELGQRREDKLCVKVECDTVSDSSDKLIQYAMEYADPEMYHHEWGARLLPYDSTDEDDINVGELSVNAERVEKCLRETGEVNVVDFIESNDTDATDFAAKLDWSVKITKPKEISQAESFQKFEELLNELFFEDGEFWRYCEEEKIREVRKVRNYIWMLLCRSKPSSFRQSAFWFLCQKGDFAFGESRDVFHFSTIECGDFHVSSIKTQGWPRNPRARG